MGAAGAIARYFIREAQREREALREQLERGRESMPETLPKGTTRIELEDDGIRVEAQRVLPSSAGAPCASRIEVTVTYEDGTEAAIEITRQQAGALYRFLSLVQETCAHWESRSG